MYVARTLSGSLGEPDKTRPTVTRSDGAGGAVRGERRAREITNGRELDLQSVAYRRVVEDPSAVGQDQHQCGKRALHRILRGLVLRAQRLDGDVLEGER